MMDMPLMLLITKKHNVVVLRTFSLFTITLLFLFASCSSSKPKLRLDAHTAVMPSVLTNGPTKPVTHDGFVDKAKEYGLEGQKAVHLYAVDFDNDGETDLVTLEDFYAVPKFFRFFRRQQKFVELPYNPFGESLRASFLVFADLNKDGIQDIFLATLNQKSELSQNPIILFKGELVRGEIRYKKVRAKFKTGTLPTSSLSLLDIDLDGNLDLFQGNWFDTGKKTPGPINDVLYCAKSPFEFEQCTDKLIGEFDKVDGAPKFLTARPTFGSSTCDIDQNGYPDILTSSSGGYDNKLWINQYSREAGRIFKDFGEVSGYSSDLEGKLLHLGGGNSFYSICADYNNDGIMDIATGELSHSYDLESRDRSSILTGGKHGLPPKFIRMEYYLENNTANWNQGDRRALWADLNNDGLLDLLIDNSGFPPTSRMVLFKQEEDHSFSDMSKVYGVDILNPSGTVFMDVNKDGKLDLVTGQSNLRNPGMKTRLYLFENQLEHTRSSIRFHLRGQKSNMAGLGALIILKMKNKEVRQWVEYAQGGLPSQNEEGILFGRGEDQLKSVEVRWPIKVTDKLGRVGPLIRTYNLSKFNHTKSMDFTLCESGKIFAGKSKCY